MRAEHDGLLDVAGARRPRDQVDRARHAAALARGSARTHPPCRRRCDSTDTTATWVSGQQCRRGRRIGAGSDDQRPGLGDRAEHAGDAEQVVAEVGPRLDRQSCAAPNRGPRIRASTRRGAMRCASRVGASSSASSSARRAPEYRCERPTRATVLSMSVGTLHEARDRSRAYAGAGPARVRSDIRLGLAQLGSDRCRALPSASRTRPRILSRAGSSPALRRA